MGAELFYANRRTDGQREMTKLKMAIRNFSNVPKKSLENMINANSTRQ